MSQHAPAAQAADVEDAEGIARRCCRQIPRAGHQRHADAPSGPSEGRSGETARRKRGDNK